MRDVVACHCGLCRKTSGHYWAASSVPHERFRLTRPDGLAWFESSPGVQRGFCRACGASLFWDEGKGAMHFAPGAMDGPIELTVARHIFNEGAGDYYAPAGPPPTPTEGATLLDCSCLFGGVAFALPGPAGKITACHCTQCRKISGFHAASFDADVAGIVYQAREALGEYRTPGGGRRGHCTRCGSSLWFLSANGEFSVEAGSVNGATGGWLSEHIFVADKGDYYDIGDGLPQFAGWAEP